MSDSVFDDLCKHGWLWEGPCAWCEKERLTAELAEKDKRIESLEQALAKASLRTQELEEAYDRLLREGWMEWKKAGQPGDWEQSATKGRLSVSYDAIDAMWKYINRLKIAGDNHCSSLAVVIKEVLALAGIVACEECEGMGNYQEIRNFNWTECESCHGHGWVITSVDVDKYGRIGTGEE